jgi:hypothetical protein
MVIVGTWNLENLFRPGGDGAPSTDAAYQATLDALAGVINRLAPDVLAVQEVGDPGALADLAGKHGSEADRVQSGGAMPRSATGARTDTLLLSPARSTRPGRSRSAASREGEHFQAVWMSPRSCPLAAAAGDERLAAGACGGRRSAALGIPQLADRWGC